MSVSRKLSRSYVHTGGDAGEVIAQKPWAALYLGYALIAAEAALLVFWFSWAQQQFVHHELEKSTEAMLAAPHFVVLLSLCTLISDLKRTCKTGVCKAVHATFAWVAPTVVATMFDILSLQRARLLFPDDKQLYAVTVFGLLNSVFTAMWCLWVVFDFAGFLQTAD